MRLRELFFHEPVVVPGHVSISGGGSQYRDQAFHVDDGWTLERLERGVFSIYREGMERPAIVEVCDCSYTRLPEPMAAETHTVTSFDRGEGETAENATVTIGEHPLAMEPRTFKRGKRH